MIRNKDGTEPKPLTLFCPDLLGVLFCKYLADGRLASLTPLTFARARINVGPVNGRVYDDGW